jgi:hypothetical protein
MSEAAIPPRRLSRRGLWCLVAAVGLVALAFIVGIIASVLGPGDDSLQTYGPISFPLIANLVSTPLLIAAIVLAIVSLAKEGPGVLSIITLVVGVALLLPFGLGFYGVAMLLTGNA